MEEEGGKRGGREGGREEEGDDRKELADCW